MKFTFGNHKRLNEGLNEDIGEHEFLTCEIVKPSISRKKSYDYMVSDLGLDKDFDSLQDFEDGATFYARRGDTDFAKFIQSSFKERPYTNFGYGNYATVKFKDNDTVLEFRVIRGATLGYQP